MKVANIPIHRDRIYSSKSSRNNNYNDKNHNDIKLPVLVSSISNHRSLLMQTSFIYISPTLITQKIKIHNQKLSKNQRTDHYPHLMTSVNTKSIALAAEL